MGDVIFAAGDRACYEGSATTNGAKDPCARGILIRGDIVTVIVPNEDFDDACVVRLDGALFTISCNLLTWLEGGAI